MGTEKPRHQVEIRDDGLEHSPGDPFVYQGKKGRVVEVRPGTKPGHVLLIIEFD